MLTAILAILGGLVGLALGGELLVRGAVGIARKLGISPLVTGVVIVGAATSMPELVASVQAALAGSPAIAWGNVVGSNIANSLLILGATALVAPILLQGIGKRDAVAGLVAAAAVWLVAVLQLGSVWIGGALLAGLVGYIVWRVRGLPPVGPHEQEPGRPRPFWLSLVLFAAGLAALILGGQFLVEGAIVLAQMAGISEAAIGLTVVAVGTSLPELAATLAAALRGRPELAVGNVVGSNLFNLLLIGGTTMAIAPQAIAPELLDTEFPAMAGAMLLILLLCWRARRIGRLLGAGLLAAFALSTALVFAI